MDKQRLIRRDRSWELRKLERLREEGLLTEEYKKKHEEIINSKVTRSR